jgi:uncharacterized protein YgiM (DUF1202 family)
MKIRKRLLRGIAGIFAGVCALSLSKNMAMAASVNVATSLADFNQGAAQILDSLEYAKDDDVLVPKEDASDTCEEEEPPSGLVMADVVNSLNVREEPSTDASKVGFLYADCGGEILETTEGWTKIKSGNLVGWCSNDYLLFGEDAKELADSVGHAWATIEADALRVRKSPSDDAGVYGLVKKGDVIETNIDKNTDEWLSIEYEGYEGFISAEYVDIEFRVDTGETIEEVNERKKREKAERAKLIANLGPVAIDTTDDVLLAALIQCESGNQPYEGQLAVGAVVMNRVRSGAYPNTVAGVIYASGQFGPAASGKVEAQVAAGVKDSCLQAAHAAINGDTNVGTATHFKRVGAHEGVEIGAHVFW